MPNIIDINADIIQSWLNNPVTQAMLEGLKYNRQQALEAVIIADDKLHACGFVEGIDTCISTINGAAQKGKFS